MSRIGRMPITVPAGVEVKFDANKVTVKGPKGTLTRAFHPNMKITVDCRDRLIVNISGGGCPDVPWLAHCLCGKTLDTAPEPLSMGQTLCCYSLQKAFEEIRRQLACGS